MPTTRSGTEDRRIGAYLSVPPSVMEWALSVQNEELGVGNVKPIGEILIEREQITHEDLMSALETQRLDRLRQCALFADLSDPDLSWISENSEEIALAAGQQLLRQNERGDSIYALLSGRLLIYRRDAHKDGIPVGVAIPGDFLGDTDYLSQGTRSITACAVDPSLMLRTRYELLRDCASFSHEAILGADEKLFSLSAAQSAPESIAEPRGAGVPAADRVDPDALMERIVERAARVMHADRAHLFFLDPEAGDLYTRVAGEGESRTFRVQKGAEIVGLVAQTGDLVTVPEAYLDARFNPAIDIWTGYWTRTLIAGPVRDPGGAIIGVVQVVNKNKGFFNHDDEVLFRACAHQSANAIQSCLRK